MKKFKFNQKKLEVFISKDLEEEIKKYRQKSYEKEKGGVILGKLYPSINQIEITHIIVANTTKSSKFTLDLDTDYIQEKIEKVWKESNGQITYLGDWHTHPEENANPSFTDFKTFIFNFYKSKIDQNILIYLIIGRKRNWFKSFNGIKFCEI